MRIFKYGYPQQKHLHGACFPSTQVVYWKDPKNKQRVRTEAAFPHVRDKLSDSCSRAPESEQGESSGS